MRSPAVARPTRAEPEVEPDAPVLRVQDLTIDFRLPTGLLRAVDGVGFSLRRGGCFALVGESGSGKSTIAQCVQGILPRTATVVGGRVTLGPGRAGEPAVDITGLGRDSRAMLALRGARVATIFQEPMSALSPLHSIGDQVGEPLRLHKGLTRRQADAAVPDLLARARFPDPIAAARMYPFELSGGLRQRAMIAMALACEPDILIADEPTTALDVTTQAEILALIDALRRDTGLSVLLITHDLGVVAHMAEHMVVLHRGRVKEAGPVQTLFQAPAHPYLKALMGAVPRLRGDVPERLTPLRDIPVEPARLYALRQQIAPDAARADPVMLRLEAVEKSFPLRQGGLFRRQGGTVHAVRGVNLEVHAGTCLGLVGESGCGKTTLMRLITGALRPTEGRVLFDAGDGPADVAHMDRGRLTRYRREAQYVFQDPFGSLNPRMTVREILTEPLLVHGIGTPTERADRAAELLRVVGLDRRVMARHPHSFSGGQRQRLSIARALALGPRLLLCDEPVSALDVSVQAQILNLLGDLRAVLGLTMLFVSHNLAVVRHVADTIVVMCAGRLVEAAPAERLVAEARHPYTQALLAAVPEPEPGLFVRPEVLGAARASDPAAWPAPYAPGADGATRWHDLGEGHLVAVGEET
ncbi:ABC transporter ATP-binding protein [Roseospira marina]|uniref:ABC transporter ATP-binding protein n=1 Tax=Roseospira marina TaxID=140057 RepID=A0A5M6IBW3_9PROT|nr:ABC transporter ATP-binding protein [Roseospira marina]KAA5605731.1 ABC transporter ATP-binding protein [Roseospira marina]MBB4313532.1 peptide/nickel transport system ATP-binding protein [Roseospira marina]MBB5086694.1 peptide/nickel transport system ATP-binding protein [Roseospira marina]